MRFIYLHGFASSPASRKARLFQDRLLEHGIHLETPELAPDFAKLTITGQLEIVKEVVAGELSVLIGSSLGGYLAALYAAANPADVDRLVLLAPAFNFYQLWKKELGPLKLAEWREIGTIHVYHYAACRETELGFQLMEDAERYQPFPDFKQPSLVLHGLKDAVVPFEQSAQFAAGRAGNTELISFDSGHELTDVLDEVWNAASKFLILGQHGVTFQNV
jgi:predicted esterase YcpF (UPF0227 family)